MLDPEAVRLATLDSGVMTQLCGTISAAIKKRVEEETAAAIEKAKREVEAKLHEIVAGVCLSLERNVSLQTFGQDIVVKYLIHDKRT